MMKSSNTRTNRGGASAAFIGLIFSCLLAALPAQEGAWRAEGLASWYGPGFEGRKTANGEVFDSSQWTAAHRSLPFSTLVLLVNPANGKRCVVRINDRGPFIEGRLMDLSRAAAEHLGFAAAGLARLSMEEVRGLKAGPVDGLQGTAALAGTAALTGTASMAGTGQQPGASAPSLPSPAVPTPVTGASYDVQVASYRDIENARRAVEGLRASGYSPDIQSSGGYHRVFLRALPAEGLERERRRLSSLGFPGVIIRLSTPLR